MNAMPSNATSSPPNARTFQEATTVNARRDLHRILNVGRSLISDFPTVAFPMTPLLFLARKTVIPKS